MTVAVSTLKPEIDNSMEKPTVRFASSDEIIIKISQEDYDAEKECMPALEKKET